MNNRVRVLLPMVALSILAAGCAKGSDSAAATGPSAPTGSTASESPSPVESPTVSESPSPEPSPSPELEDGRHFGFIRALDAEASTVQMDLAYFLTGDAATEAAQEHGDEAPPPNDYYIVNDNPKLRTLGLAPDVRIVLLDWDHCCDRTIEADPDVFAQAIDAGPDGFVTIDGTLYYGRVSPYWFTIQDGVVTRIEEQYLP